MIGQSAGILILAATTFMTIFVCFGVVLLFKDAVRGFYTRQFGSGAADLLVGLTPFPAVIVMFVGFWWLHRYSKKIPELECPHRHKSLVGMQHLVVATKNCPHCGQHVPADPNVRAADIEHS